MILAGGDELKIPSASGHCSFYSQDVSSFGVKEERPIRSGIEQMRRYCIKRSKKSRLLACLFVIYALVLALPEFALAQHIAEPQAETPEEFDAYLSVLEKTTQGEIIVAAQEFERNWPFSEMRAHVFEMEMEAYRSLNDSQLAIQAGEKALKCAPNNLAILAQLAYIIADAGSDSKQLERAAELATLEIEMAKNLRLPRSMALSEAEQLEGQWGSTAHSALGLVAYKHGKLANAIREFEMAENLAPSLDPSLSYRLGLLYKMHGDLSRAMEEFQRVVQFGDSTTAVLAQTQLKNLHPGSAKIR
jgi:tetratricopeptide (TPR) repeat protein